MCKCPNRAKWSLSAFRINGSKNDGGNDATISVFVPFVPVVELDDGLSSGGVHCAERGIETERSRAGIVKREMKEMRRMVVSGKWDKRRFLYGTLCNH